MSSCRLEARWGARRETVEACAERTVAFYRVLVGIHPLLENWFQLGKSRKEALTKPTYTASVDQMREILLQGRNRRDIGKEVIEELGYRSNLWNGAADFESASVKIHAGLYSDNNWLFNSVEFDMKEGLADALGRGGLLTCLRAVVDAWQPDRAVIRFVDVMQDRGYERRYTHWMFYVPTKILVVPAPSVVLDVPNRGSIIVVKPEPPSLDNPEDVEAIRCIEELIK